MRRIVKALVMGTFMIGLSAGGLGLTGCKGNKLLQAQKKFAEKACACKNIACIKELQKEQAAFVQKHGQAAVGSQSDAKKMQEYNQKMTKCITKIVRAGK
jgi:hypothetical protein